MAPKLSMDKFVSLCKRRGFVFQGSEIYGGIGGFWDYGPLGVELKNNIKRAWWKAVVQERPDVVGLDAAIVMNPKVWIASGHVETFADPMVDCKSCKRRFRADELAREHPEPEAAHGHAPSAYPIRCPECGGELTTPRMFNLMFRTYVGPIDVEAEFTRAIAELQGEDWERASARIRDLKEELDRATAYLRPETAQGIFVNFDNVLTTARKKLPFGIAQIGKAFRNEVTPGNFIFRDREFEQMEIEFFCRPGTDEEWHKHWVEERYNWYRRYGIREENLRVRRLDPDELAHYAKDTYEIEYLFPMGWSELEGIANRTDFDLKRHSEFSGRQLTYFDDETGEHIVPFVIEPSAGVDRCFMAFMMDAYDEEEVRGETRAVLRLHPALAPIKVAVLPLSRHEDLVPVARRVWDLLRPHFMTQYDDAQSIGRRYRRQDEIGTPCCVTIDFETLQDEAVTIRDRDSMAQVRVPIANLVQALKEKLGEL
ncbi:MAG: glycine--tRNA ligase [Dehalococcoidia bacterium]|nr:glycine--tRNA ligase [Dehalococcoidia bacterium]MDW8008115.1 glycine--tRNA ligase [Chloroflexota bacterium]